MSDFGYLQNDAAISRESARRLDPPDFGPSYCNLCGEEEEDCERGLGCIRCALCNGKKIDCSEDCDPGHAVECAFPMETCICKRLREEFAAKAADMAMDAALEEKREERAS